MPEFLNSLVRKRANERCEYCRLPQEFQEATFHVDHIRPLTNGGKTVPGNLALACVSCSLRKGARTKAKDPKTGRLAVLFHPRSHNWEEHFAFTAEYHIAGITPIGRATIHLLALNRPVIVAIRRELSRGMHES